jgi:hypothetical protein
LALVALLGAASSGVSGFFSLAGIYALVVAIVAFIRGHVDWARLRGRTAAGVALGASIVSLAIGGATASPTPQTPIAPPPAASASSASPTAAVSTPTSSTSTTPTPSATTSTAVRAPAAKGTALAALAELPVKGRAPKTGYSRAVFGQALADVDRNGCDTRNDVLRRDLKGFTLKAGTNGCLVLSGTLMDPYTGKTVSFIRGTGTSSVVQIDHVVALSDAWQKGAQKLSLSTRTAFANDPLNLLAVSASVNLAKGDGDAATWLPPRTSYRCNYVARQVAVKAKYRLWVTAAEKAAIARILGGCPTQMLPTSRTIALGGGTVITPTSPPPSTKAPAPSGLDPRFDTCKAARAAGYGPYYSGKDPEYDWYRDGDSDGIVCE